MEEIMFEHCFDMNCNNNSCEEIGRRKELRRAFDKIATPTHPVPAPCTQHASPIEVPAPDPSEVFPTW